MVIDFFCNCFENWLINVLSKVLNCDGEGKFGMWLVEFCGYWDLEYVKVGVDCEGYKDD